MLRVTSATAPMYVEALYWRAVLATTAADAERDYRRVAIEYSLSPRAPEALLRLAQLEIARGQRDLAIGHLELLIREYPNAPTRPTASYWIAYALFSDGASADLPRACAALADASVSAGPANLEVKNQVEFYAS